MNIIKNIEPDEVLELAGLVQVLPGQVVSKTLVQNGAVGITLFAFAAGEEISSHDSKGDAMVVVLEGEGKFTVGGRVHRAKAGQALVMPANVPHAVKAPSDFKMMLTVVFPRQ